MKATIVNFRMARHHVKGNHMIINIEGVNSREEAQKLIDKTVVWRTPGAKGKEIKGVIKAAHGNNGAVRVVFEKGMPGQAIGTEVIIE